VSGVRRGHGGADLAFDERAEEQGEVVAAEQGFDAGGVVQPDRVGVLDGFEEVVDPAGLFG